VARLDGCTFTLLRYFVLNHTLSAYYLQEIVRIMKPGGTFEIIEDDLQFPCPLSHPIIQETYYSLLSSLFINAWPLSLLPNLLNTHLRKVRTLQFDQEGNPKRKCEDDKLEDKGEEERRRMYVARTYAAVLAMKSAMRDRCCGGTAGVSIESFDKAWRRFEKLALSFFLRLIRLHKS
jgi:hypothetical protein